MFFIGHRGNINGPNPEKENSPDYILECIKTYDAEIDVWLINDQLYLGHDKPQYPINKSFLIDNKDHLWVHCKNVEALNDLVFDVHCFFHQNDNVVLTSKLFLWTFPGKKLTEKSVAVLPEIYSNWKIFDTPIQGICSDYIENYKKLVI